MGAGLQLAFSHRFSTTIWNTLVVPNKNILILETRDDKNFKTTFSALDFTNNTFLWKDVAMSESWWIGMTAVNENTLLLHTFVNKGNPDQKNLIALDVYTHKIRWQVEGFSFSDWDASEIRGYRTTGEIVKAIVDPETGTLKEDYWEDRSSQDLAQSVKPQLYLEQSPHFETIRKFMELKANVHLKGGAEYLEFKNWILISAYFEENGLANYLYVFDKAGKIVLREKLGEKLQGLGVDTFFILSGCLFLIKNKSELVAFRVYD